MLTPVGKRTTADDRTTRYDISIKLAQLKKENTCMLYKDRLFKQTDNYTQSSLVGIRIYS